VWRFPNDLPIEGRPADVYSTFEKAEEALIHSTYPKLLIVGNPGSLVTPAFADSFAKKLKNCTVAQLSSGLHYLQEDHPDVIGANIKEWLLELGISSKARLKTQHTR
jgi:haloalkane dehalogenase